MNTVLINPPLNLDLRQNIFSTQYPLNLGYLGAVLEKNGFSVKLYDYAVENFNEEEFLRRIKDDGVRLAGVTAMTNTIISAGRLIRILKKNFPEVTTVLGGTHPTALPERTFEEIPELDYIIMGEGELTLLELCKTLENSGSTGNIQGLAFREEDGTIVKNPRRPLIEDLDVLPFPSRDLSRPELYCRSHTSRGISRKFLKIAELMTSRGCPSQCIFCAGHISYGYRVRFRSAENVLAEAEECVRKYGIQHFTILDDTFTLKPERTAAICEGLKKMGATFDCNTRVNAVSRELIVKMAETGCKKISFGIESGSQRMLKLIKKGTTVEEIKRAVGWAREAGIHIVEGTFILGSHPAETRSDIEETLKLMKELDLDFISYGIIVPFPGTEVYEIMLLKGLLSPKVSWDKFVFAGEPPWRIENFSASELLKIQKRVYREFFLRPGYVLKRIKRTNIRELKYYSGALADFIKNLI
ncbi:MAG: radical SAM protein [Patescibacteria group bacterium]|jgi:radical SAM superfamily enzyme YgiQ (UPF0313 family)